MHRLIEMKSRSLFSVASSCILICLLLLAPSSTCQNVTVKTKAVAVGVILDLDTYIGKMGKTCVEMAVEDFYAAHSSYTTRLVLHTRDSRSDPVVAASAAIDLLKNHQTKAILGPQQSRQAEFVADIGNATDVPIISFTATSPLLSQIEAPYFIRMALVDTAQINAIAAFIKAAEWREVVPIYERTNYGSGILSYLAEAVQQIGARIPYRSGISPSATDDQILKELYKLMTMQTRVFIVHMLPSLAYRVFLKANEAGMMTKGYAWIVTDEVTSLFGHTDQNVMSSMQGVIGVKTYIPESKELHRFSKRWEKKFRAEYPGVDRVQLNAYGLGAYDSVYSLAMAVENTAGVNSQFTRPTSRDKMTDLEAIGISKSGPELLQLILNNQFTGLSGKVRLMNGQRQPSAFQIVNMIGNETKKIVFWTKDGITEQLPATDANQITERNYLKKIVWPGNSKVVPKGWEIPTNEKKLTVGVPVKAGFSQFINVERNPLTNALVVTGYCKEVFDAVIRLLPYAVRYEFEAFEGSGLYDDLVKNVSNGSYDAVVGDITIRSNRANFADFTLPYTESGVYMIVPLKGDERKNAWVFLRPMKTELWLIMGAFFLYTGFVIWVLEHQVNNEFRGPPSNQVGMIFWFSFSTMVFAQKEKVISNLSKFVLVVWIFAVFVLTSGYTASLTSFLTVQQLQPAITGIDDLIKNGDKIGYQEGSFVYDLLQDLKVNKSKLKMLGTLDDYDEALSNGTVSAVVDELPYLRLVLAKYCSKYRLIGPTNKTVGFGFAFTKGSPLVPEVSRAILNLTGTEEMTTITKAWLSDQTYCTDQGSTNVTSNSLSVDSFGGLFLIAGLSSTTALVIFIINFFYENRSTLASRESVKQKVAALARTFDEKKEDVAAKAAKAANAAERETEMVAVGDVSEGSITDASMSPGAISFSIHEGMLVQYDGFSSTEPGTPYREPPITENSEHRNEQLP